MSLPNSYESPLSYFSDTLLFLREYQWMYNYPNTHILANNVLDKFPGSWQSYFQTVSNDDLNNLSHGIIKNDAPESLKTFYTKIASLKPHQLSIDNTKSEGTNFPKTTGVGQKKLHEIYNLAPLIRDVCEKQNANFVVDIGSGVGYLPEILHANYNYSILGIEGSEEKIKLAQNRQNVHHPKMKEHVKFAQHFVTTDSTNELKTILKDTFPSVNKCIIAGLHACADLSPTILKLSLEIDFVKSIVIMPCCYHRMQIKNSTAEGRETFLNFPLSNTLRSVYEKIDGGRFLRRYFLRLACQRSVSGSGDMTEEERDIHARNCLYRAVLEDVVQKENYKITRQKRKSGINTASADIDSDFLDYVDRLKATHAVLDGDGHQVIDDPRFKERMLGAWAEHKGALQALKALSCFQTAIQSICENVVLLDRVDFLRENGVRCSVAKVTDDGISPRCYALVAHKQ